MKSIFEQLLLNNRLIKAAGNGDTALVEILLDQDAEIHAASDCALRRATDGGHTETVALLIDRGADIHVVNDIALRSAVRSGHTAMIALLLSRYKITELQSLKNATNGALGGMDKLQPFVTLEIARRLVQIIIADQPPMEI